MGEWPKIVYGKSHGYNNADESLIHKRRHFDGCFLFHFLFEKGGESIPLHFPKRRLIMIAPKKQIPQKILNKVFDALQDELHNPYLAFSYVYLMP